MIDAILLSQVRRLSASDRLELIGAVWETFDPSEVPVTDAEKALLDARISNSEQNPQDQRPWPEVQARLRQRLR